MDKEIIKKIATKIKWIPWRLEEVENNEGFQIFIDYAHTPDALENVLNSLNKIKGKWKIITVFWATWDRDKTKRPIMWKVVSEKSDYVILTQDDDYSESTTSIIKDVLPGIERAEWEDFWIIADREEAIRTALVTAKKGDIVLITWKWDEHVLVTQNWPIKWHDKSKVLEILKDLDDNKLVESKK
jgi:UDP-N-acetylmuramoyl-L-alanyl-D-glutamate--2,6-diaminopimelate ligase